jgi:ankyrin repeat protein
MLKIQTYILTVTLLALNGCGTYVSRQIDYYAYYFGPVRTPIFSGVKWDIENQGAEHGKPISYLIFFDIPLSLLADCIILPYTAYETFGYRGLSEAAVSGDNKQIETLLSYGVAIDEPDWQGHTPLMGAVIGEQIETVDLLLKKGASVNKQSRFGRDALGYLQGPGSFSNEKPGKNEDRRKRREVIRTLLIQAGAKGLIKS